MSIFTKKREYSIITNMKVVSAVRDFADKHCAASGFEVKALFTCPEIISEREEKAIADKCGDDISIFRVPAAVYDRIALRDSTEGIVAEVAMKERPLSGLRLRENPLILVLESVEKPGNLGAVLRTADAT